MHTTISNKMISITVSNAGAELKELIYKQTDQNFMWSGDAQYWGRTAPVIFPTIGRLKDDKYTYNEQEYSLTQHGFARDSQFALIEENDHSLRYRLSSSEASLKKYPFEFQFDIIYSLIDAKLKVTYEVSNSDEKELLFSIGGHPGFNCQWQKNDQISDYYLEFEKKENVQQMLLDIPYFSGEYRPYLENTQIFSMDENTFNNDAIVLTELQSKVVRLKRHQGSEQCLAFNFSEFPLLGIWSPPKAPFVCIEPWFGHADFIDHNGRFEDKKGLLNLASGKTFSCSYEIAIETN